MKRPSSLPTALQNSDTFSSRRLIGCELASEVDRPLLSIAIPTYRRFDLLAEALASVFRLRFDIAVEVLVVDNDPDDDITALEAMSAFADKPLFYYKNKVNVGMVQNWNRCLELASGDFVTILHDDDLLEPAFSDAVNLHVGLRRSIGSALGWSNRILDERVHRPAASDVSPLRRMQRWIAALRREREPRIKSAAHFFFSNQFTGTLGVVLHREMALALGGFNPAWHPIADYEFWCRWAVAYGPIPILRPQVGLYRMRQNESMLPETRQAFVTHSRRLRERMIRDGEVPAFYRVFLGTIQQVQQASIEEDWRVSDQKSLSWLMSLKLIGWRAATVLLCSVESSVRRRCRKESSSS